VEQFAYAGVFRRRVLPPWLRETCIVGTVAVLDKQSDVQWHAKAALRLGATAGQLRWAAISQIPHVGFPPIVQAMRSLDTVVTDWLAHP
jgi:alkylhydroperoxidase/carboxymuconolactone decarboxylase family protein YurZ